MNDDGRYSIVQALSDMDIDDNGDYDGDGHILVLELLKSFNVKKLQDVHSNFDSLKSEIEKLILLRT